MPMTTQSVAETVSSWPAPLRAALALPFATLPSMVALQATLRGGHPALVVDGEVLDYATLHARTEQVAGALQRDGLRPGDTVAICAATSLAYVATYLGAARAGVAVAPLPPSATPEQLASLAANAGAVRLFTDAAWQTPLVELPRILLDDSGSGGMPWSNWLQNAPAPQAATTTPQHPFNLIYSSGTTGVPKGIVQSCGMRWAQVQRAPANGFGPDAVTLLAIPLYSNLTLTYLFGALGLGGTVVLMPKFDAGGYLALAARHRATHSMLVPVQFRRLLDHPDFDGADLSTLAHKFCAGAPFAADLKAEVLRPLAGRTDRVLRHDRRRRAHRAAGAPASRTSCIPSGASAPWQRHPADRRGAARCRRRDDRRERQATQVRC